MNLSFPKEIQNLLEKFNISLTIEDFIVYTEKDSIIDSATCTSENGIYIQWETIKENIYVTGELLD